MSLCDGRKIDVYPSTILGSPVIYLNTFFNAGSSVYKKLLALGCPDFSLAAISKRTAAGICWILNRRKDKKI